MHTNVLQGMRAMLQRGHQQRRETQMDSAFATAPYPAYTTNELHAFVAAGRGNPVMLAEIARRAARDAGDTSVMTPGERLRHIQQQKGA
jgi:hypothetical protein